MQTITLLLPVMLHELYDVAMLIFHDNLLVRINILIVVDEVDEVDVLAHAGDVVTEFSRVMKNVM